MTAWFPFRIYSPGKLRSPPELRVALAGPSGHMSYIGKGGQVQAGARPAGGGGLTSGQKGLFALAAVLFGPSLLKSLYDKPKEAVDLSAYNIVTRYDTPAIERMDSTLRIEFCQS